MSSQDFNSVQSDEMTYTELVPATQCSELEDAHYAWQAVNKNLHDLKAQDKEYIDLQTPQAIVCMRPDDSSVVAQMQPPMDDVALASDFATPSNMAPEMSTPLFNFSESQISVTEGYISVEVQEDQSQSVMLDKQNDDFDVNHEQASGYYILPPAAEILAQTHVKFELKPECEFFEVKNEPVVQESNNRKRSTKTAAPSIEELKAEIKQIEEDPNHDEELLKKKRNNLACRVHRSKKKRIEEDMECDRTTLEMEVKNLQKDLKEKDTRLRKMQEDMRKLKTNPEMPPKLVKWIDARGYW